MKATRTSICLIIVCALVGLIAMLFWPGVEKPVRAEDPCPIETLGEVCPDGTPGGGGGDIGSFTWTKSHGLQNPPLGGSLGPPDALNFHDDGTVTYLSPIDPAQDAARDHVVVEPSSGTLTFRLPLPHQVKGRAADGSQDLNIDMIFRSNFQQRDGKMGTMGWQLSPFRVLAFEAILEGERCVQNPEERSLQTIINSTPQIYLHDADRGTIVWSNRDAVLGEKSFAGIDAMGLTSGNLSPAGQLNVPTDGTAWEIEDYCASLTATPAPTLNPLKFADFDDAELLRPGFVEFAPPPGTQAKLHWDCDGVQIRWKDGTIDYFTRFAKESEQLVKSDPEQGSTGIGGGIGGPPVLAADAINVQYLAAQVKTEFPNGDTIEYLYDDTGRLVVIQDVFGRHAIEFAYDGDTNRVAEIKDLLVVSTPPDAPVQRTTNFGYDSSGALDGNITTWDGTVDSKLWTVDMTSQIDTDPAAGKLRGFDQLVLPLDLKLHRPGDPAGIPFMHAQFDVYTDPDTDDHQAPISSRLTGLYYGGYLEPNNAVDVTAGGQTYSFTTGQALTYEYEDSGCSQPTKTTVTDIDTGHVREYLFDWQSREIERTDIITGPGGSPLHLTTEYEYSAGIYPMVTKTTYPEGNSVTQEYQAQNWPANSEYFTRAEATGKVPRDHFADANVVKSTQWSTELDPGGGYSKLIDTYKYEPFLNQVREHVNPEGHKTIHTFDYQESNSIETLLGIWDILYLDTKNERWNLGDLIANGGNGDGDDTQEAGNRIRTDHPTVTVPASQDAYELWRYADAGLLASAIDAEGYETQYTYYDEGKPAGNQGSSTGVLAGYLHKVTQVDSGGNAVTEYGYDEAGKETWSKSPNGAVSYREYDVLNRVKLERTGDIAITGVPNTGADDVYTETQYEFNQNGLLQAKRVRCDDEALLASGQTDRLISTEYGYDLHDKVRVIAQELVEPAAGGPTSRWLRWFFHYDGSGNLTKECSPEHRSTTYKYDEIGRLLEKRQRAWADCNPSSPQSPMETVNDPLINYTYDGNGNMLTAEVTRTNGVSAITTMEYDGFDRRRKLTAPDLTTTEHELDDNSNVIAVKITGLPHPDETVTQALSEASYLYDERDRLYEVTTDTFLLDPDNSYQRVDLNGGTSTAKLTYDKRSLLVSTENDHGEVTATEYDAFGRKKKVTLPLVTGHSSQNTEEFKYDLNGNLTETITTEIGDGTTEVFTDKTAYDSLDRVVSTTNGFGSTEEITSTLGYSSLGMQIKSVNPGTDSHPLGVGTRSYFDSLGRQVATKYGFDHDFTVTTGLITGPANADGFIEVTSAYDDDGNLISQTDDAGNTTLYGYDTLGRKDLLTYADGTKEVIAYNREGTIVSETMKTAVNAQLYSATYTYDVSDRKLTSTFDLTSTAISLSGVTSEAFKYDGLSRVVEAVANSEDPWDASRSFESVVKKAYDSTSLVRADDQSLEIDDGSPATISDTVDLVYDSLGRRTSVTATNYDRSYVFDELDRIKSVGDGSTTLHTFKYLGAGHRLDEQTNSFNGTSTIVGTGNYDGLRRLTGIEHKLGSTLQTGFSYSYDNVGNQLTELKTHTLHQAESASRKYEYDAGSRIKDFYLGTTGNWGTSVEHFGLDGVGNWLDRDDDIQVLENSVNEMNEYTGTFDGSTAVAYDERGNLTQNGSQTYVYDVKSRIVGAKVGTTEYTYAFDAEGRRVYGEGIDDSGDGWFFTHEAAREIQQSRVGASDRISFTYGTGVDEILSFDVYDGTASSDYSVQQNRLGSVMALADSSGTLVERYDYSPFGDVTKIDTNGGDPVDSPMLFAGRREDKGTGLFFLRARSYVAAMGRFAARDQIGLWGDANNWGNAYAYGGNNPLAGVDPSGNEYDKAWSKPRGWDPSIRPAGQKVLHDGISQGIERAADENVVKPAQQFMRDPVGTAMGLMRSFADPVGSAMDSSRAVIDDVKERVTEYRDGDATTKVAVVVRATIEGLAAMVSSKTSLVKGVGSPRTVGLDTNAIIARLEGGASDLGAISQAIGDRTPLVSITATKEYLAGGGDVNALRSFLSDSGGGVGSAAPRSLVEQLGELGLKAADAQVAGSAIQEGTTLLTRDKGILNKIPEVAEKF